MSVPGDIDLVLTELETRLESPMPMADFLYSDPSHLKDLVLSSAYVGETRLGDMRVHHLAFRGESVDWQFWIQADGDPLPRKIVITYREDYGSPQFVAFLHHWELDPAFDDGHFTFQPNEDMQRIDVLADAPAPEAEP